MNDFSQNALAFNCGYIMFKKLHMVRVPPVQLPWQQQDHTHTHSR